MLYPIGYDMPARAGARKENCPWSGPFERERNRMNIGIVGLGLIGGSMAKSIKKRTGHSVYGIDLDGETMELARMCGCKKGIGFGDGLSA